MALLKLRSQISPTNRAWNDAQTLTCILQALYSPRESDYSPACRLLREERERGREESKSCSFVLPYKCDKINSSCLLWQKTTLWPEHTHTLAPIHPHYGHLLVPMLIRTVIGDLLPFFSALHTHTRTHSQLREQRCLGCLQRWVKDIKNPIITQINWANGKCDSRAAEVLFTTQSHLQAEEQRSQGCENTDSSRSLYRVVKGKI